MRAAFLSFMMLSALALGGAGIYASDSAGDEIASNGYGVDGVAE